MGKEKLFRSFPNAKNPHRYRFSKMKTGLADDYTCACTCKLDIVKSIPKTPSKKNFEDTNPIEEKVAITETKKCSLPRHVKELITPVADTWACV